MNRLIRETDQVIKLNLRQLAVFEVLFRLVAGTFYIRLANQLLRFSLRMAGYSYLTMSNMGAFLWRPFTIACVAAAIAVGMVLMVVEIAGLITAYQASAYSRRIDSLSILKGAVDKAVDECKKRNWKLLPLAFADFLMMNSFLLLRLLTRIKPVNFVMAEIVHGPVTRMGLVLVVVFLILIGIPTMLVFFTCMIEQKDFRDGFRRSMEILGRKWPRAVGLLLALNLGLILFLVLLHSVIVVVSAVVVTLFVDSYAAMAVLAAVCARLELAVLFIGTILVSVVDFGALTVVYYQFERGHVHGHPWDFGISEDMHLGGMHIKRKWMLTITGALAGASLFMIFDMVYNGVSPDWSVLGQTEITAHRGSTKMAPENTMAALEAAMEEMADYSEIDVQTTADGIVVLCHDLNLKRVAGVDRTLGSMTYSQLEQLDVGSHFSPTFKGERIPTLREVLEACKGRMKLNIELKNIGNDTSLPEQVAALVKEYDMEDQCVITSVKLKYLERIKAMDPDLRTGYILAAAYGNYYESGDFDFISIRSSFVSRRLVEAVHEDGKAIHVWTVNSKTEMDQMKLLGVDNIITDYPARAREILYREETTETLMEYLKMMIR